LRNKTNKQAENNKHLTKLKVQNIVAQYVVQTLKTVKSVVQVTTVNNAL